MKDAILKGGKLIFFMIGLPAFLTWTNVYFTLQRQGILLVESLPSVTGDSSSTLSTVIKPPTGIYWSMTPTAGGGGATYMRQHGVSNPRKLFGLLPSWPSISQSAKNLLQIDLNPNQPRFKLEYQSKYETYCFSTPEYMLCPDQEAKGTDRFFPPELAPWKIVGKSGKTQDGNEPNIINLRIRSFSWFKSYYFQREDKPFQQLFQRPSTCLLLALNIGLAFCYWNFRVSPNAVALMDVPLLQQFQYWRGITGTLAHFEWWHLLFNMMSLHNLGQFLEEQYYGSINFMLYNLALIPVTVLIFFGGTQIVYLVRTRLHQSNSGSHSMLQPLITRPSVNAVGYSGVLFAWMVISSLEQTKSCPIPFMDSVCFETWHITKRVKFNLGPMIQLVMASVILPRVSFGGHLAGIVAGFWLHWNLLPLELIQPSVIIPLITLLQWKLRQFIPISGSNKPTGNVLSGSPRNFLDEAGIDDDDDGDDNDTSRNHEHKNDSKISSSHNSPLLIPCRLLYHSTKGVAGMSHLLSTLLLAMIVLFGVSLLMMSWGSSILYSQAILLVLFYVCRQSYTDHWDDEGEQDNWSTEATQKKQRMLVMWKGYIVSNVLTLVMESMTLSSWILMGPALFPRLSCWVALSLLVGLIVVHLIALCLACKHWDDIIEGNGEKGIFEYSLGMCVLDNAKELGKQLLALWNPGSNSLRSSNTTNTVSSAGIVLGSRPSSSSTSSQGGATSSDRKSMAAAAAERRVARAAQESDTI